MQIFYGRLLGRQAGVLLRVAMLVVGEEAMLVFWTEMLVVWLVVMFVVLEGEKLDALRVEMFAFEVGVKLDAWVVVTLVA